MSLKLFDFIPFRMRFEELVTLKLCTICNPDFLVIHVIWKRSIVIRKFTVSLFVTVSVMLDLER
jgi:hypothetical protein